MGIFCYRVREKFSDLLEERLPGAERDRVLAHLARCAECAGDYQLFRKSHDLVTGLEPIAVPEDFTARVLARVREQGAQDDPTWIPSILHAPGRAARSLRWGSGLAAAAAVAALVVGVWMLMTHPRTNSASVPIAGNAAPPPSAVAAPRLANSPAALPATPAAALQSPVRTGTRPGQPSGPALARRSFTDSLYDQLPDQPFPLDKGSGQLVRDSQDTGYKVTPIKSRGDHR
ncbi:MAG: zf-HC2 domain-containing protein [Candidatus Eisenbacteria bacterium]|nr:zf-HC2 domain-containing protein [Candidatus Eisenbacteria bacterium]